MKKKDVKNTKEAQNCYSHAINYANKAIEEAARDAAVSDLLTLKSQLFGNRAQASLVLKNYGECIRDCNEAIQCQTR